MSSTVLKLVLAIYASIQLVYGDCTFKFPEEYDTIPQYNVIIGTRRITIPYTQDKLRVRFGTTLEIYCANGFRGRGGYRSSETIQTLECRANHDDYRGMESCKNLELQIFESDSAVELCEPSANSYVVVYNRGNKVQKVVSFCYNIDQRKLRSIRYMVLPYNYIEDHNNFQVPSGDTFILPNATGNEIAFFKYDTDYSSLFLAHLNEASSNDNWFQLARYESYTLMENFKRKNTLAPFRALFSTVWWPNLRLGNWRRFMNALQERAATVKYGVTLGTGGAVNPPDLNNCSQSKSWQAKIDSNNVTIPAYIWAHVQADDESEEFVAIAYNSPFFEMFDDNEIVFCEDMCKNITWLEEARTTFHYATLGVIFCCTVDEARDSGRLDGIVKIVPNNNVDSDTDTFYKELHDALYN